METPAFDQRKRDLLVAIVREYVKTAQPVGSALLVEKYGFDLSPATIRNEMVALEEQGLIEQPHTSAGRIPTEAGFRLFVELMRQSPSSASKTALRFRKPQSTEAEDVVKGLAKHLAENVHAAVIVAFAPQHVYYTGLSHLFRQPEFQEFGRVVRFSELIDRLDETIAGLFPRVAAERTVWIGKENPFGNLCGTVIARCPTGKKTMGVIGVLGPVRMDYERSYALLGLGCEALEEAFS